MPYVSPWHRHIADQFPFQFSLLAYSPMPENLTKSLNTKQTCQIIFAGKKMKLIKMLLVMARHKRLSTKNSSSPTKLSVALSLPGFSQCNYNKTIVWQAKLTGRLQVLLPFGTSINVYDLRNSATMKVRSNQYYLLRYVPLSKNVCPTVSLSLSHCLTVPLSLSHCPTMFVPLTRNVCSTMFVIVLLHKRKL